MNLTRREAVARLALLLGATTLSPRLLSAGIREQTEEEAPPFSTPDKIALLDEIGDTIIPPTDVPGAKATGIGAFMAMMVHDCYKPRDRAVFKAGLGRLADEFGARHGKPFLNAPAAERTEFLNGLDQAQRAYIAERRKTGNSKDDDESEPPHYFRIMKELTILGYFSSEIGCTQALRFVEIPGRYDGAMPYKNGDHAFSRG